MKIRIYPLGLAAVSLFAFSARVMGDESKIGEVMKAAFKGDTALIKSAGKGEASAEDLKKLVEYCEALQNEKPPKGEEASWKEKTEALVKAAKALEAGGKDGKALAEAANCKACHDPHRPKK